MLVNRTRWKRKLEGISLSVASWTRLLYKLLIIKQKNTLSYWSTTTWHERKTEWKKKGYFMSNTIQIFRRWNLFQNQTEVSILFWASSFPLLEISAEISCRSVATQLPEVPENHMALFSFFFFATDTLSCSQQRLSLTAAFHSPCKLSSPFDTIQVASSLCLLFYLRILIYVLTRCYKALWQSCSADITQCPNISISWS